MPAQQLQTLFQELFLADALGTDFTPAALNARLTASRMPAPILGHLTAGGIVLTTISKKNAQEKKPTLAEWISTHFATPTALQDSEIKSLKASPGYKATTQMLHGRLESLFTAFGQLQSGHSLNLEIYKPLNLETYKFRIDKEFNIDTTRKKRGAKFTAKDLEKLLKKYNKFLQKTVFVEMARSYSNNSKIKYNDEQYLAFLRILRNQEIEAIGQRQRPVFLNLNKDTGYFTAQIPLGVTGIEGNEALYTHQSYKRDSKNLSNYVLHVMGHRDENGIVTILNQSTRAASYVPIALEDDVEMLQGTINQVRQRIRSIKDGLGSEATTFTQISLLSPLAREAAGIDEQYGLKQTLFTYLAFELQNLADNKPLHMRYIVEGVNVMRHNDRSDPLKFQINTRSYNSLINDVLEKFLEKTKADTDVASKTLWRLVNSLMNKREVRDAKQKIITNWQDEIIPVLEIMRQKIANNQLDSADIATFETALAQHHELELQLFNLRQDIWMGCQDKIQTHLDQLRAAQQTGPYNLLRELDNFYFLHADNRYQNQDYNYQLQAVLHRLSADLGHEVGVNCNDSEDRTGVENAVVMASLQVKKGLAGFAPCLRQKDHLQTIIAQTKEQLPQDAGMNNTAANGTPGHQVDVKDVAGFVNAEAVAMAKETKEVYRPILKLDDWKARLRNLSFFQQISAALKYLKRKISGSPSDRLSSLFKKAGMGVAGAALAVTVATAGVVTPDTGATSALTSPGQIQHSLAPKNIDPTPMNAKDDRKDDYTSSDGGEFATTGINPTSQSNNSNSTVDRRGRKEEKSPEQSAVAVADVRNRKPKSLAAILGMVGLHSQAKLQPKARNDDVPGNLSPTHAPVSQSSAMVLRV